MKPTHDFENTIIAVATPSGIGAIALVRISGPKAIELACPLVSLSQGSSLQQLSSQRSVRATIHENENVIDQGMVTLFRAPKSYTGEDIVELSCHGGSAVLKRVLEAFIKKGARLANPGEFSQRAFLNGKMDLSQAEAVADLIQAQTEFARTTALEQLQGSLSKKITQIRDALIEILSHLEVTLDHSDDVTVGTPNSISKIKKELQSLLNAVQPLIASYGFGRIVKEGIKIAIIGKPNVGKSSLLNRLLKQERAIVTALPGTTRDTLEESFDLMGVPAILVDTAGIREKITDLAEKMGIERTFHSIQKADFVIVVMDGSEPLSPADQKIPEYLLEKKRGLVAINKCDLSQKLTSQEIKKLFPRFSCCWISALKDENIESFLTQLRASMQMMIPSQNSQQALITSARHQDCLMECEQSLKKALALCEKENMEECLALELQAALNALGEIVGETLKEDILSAIFSKFCIGK